MASSSGVAKAHKAAPKPVPWVEKYRPHKLDDVVHQDEVVAALKSTLESGNLPHMLFYGPPGTGKTSTILAACKELFGSEMMRARVLELNASDERGIDMVRNKVKKFAQLAVGRPPANYAHSCPPFKVIILDEADAMTEAAQAALRRIIEEYARVTRFCIICNYVSRIIDPLTSRCAKFRFLLLDQAVAVDRIRHIRDAEGVSLSDADCQRLVDLCGGDLRRAINTLQSAHCMYGGADITTDDLNEMTGVIPDVLVRALFEAASGGSLDAVQSVVKRLGKEGYSSSQFVSQALEYVVNAADMTEVQRSHIAVKLAQLEHRLATGAEESLQLLDLGAFIMRVLS